jgi:hypothetical protein
MRYMRGRLRSGGFLHMTLSGDIGVLQPSAVWSIMCDHPQPQVGWQLQEVS